MTFDVEVNGRRRTVSVEPVGPNLSHGRFRIEVEEEAPDMAGATGRRYAVSAQMTTLGLSIVYEPDARVVDAAVTEQSGHEMLVQFRHVAVVAIVDGRRLRREALEEPGAAGEQRLTAPMPGRIVRVLVKPGDEVAARQALVVVEAMKMENELVAVRAGRIREVAVSEGMSVQAGRLLVRLE